MSACGDIAKVLWQRLWRRRATWIWGSGDIARPCPGAQKVAGDVAQHGFGALATLRDPAQGAQKVAGDVARHGFGALATFRNISGEVATLARGAQKVAVVRRGPGTLNVAGDVSRHGFESLETLKHLMKSLCRRRRLC